MRKTLAVSVLAAVVGSLAMTASSAFAHPLYSGLQMFPTIHSPADPEEFTWEVQLYAGQTLEQVDDRHAVVRYESGHEAFTITAEAAHDATGADVSTTLTVTQPNLFTLTVHHDAGNPAAGGAPFDYPINAGEGWEGGFVSVTITGPPPTEQATVPTQQVLTPSAPRCIVPDLTGRTLEAARRQLRRSHCKLGGVRGERVRGARVVRQFRGAGRSLPAGSEVGVKLISRSRKPGNELTA